VFLAVVVPIIVLVVALADIITRDDSQVKHLPKLVWVFLVVIIPLVGAILWFTVGRQWNRPADLGSFGDRRRWDREAPAAAPPRPTRQLSTEEQLRALDAEIEFHENQARIRRLDAELEARRRDTDD